MHRSRSHGVWSAVSGESLQLSGAVALLQRGDGAAERRVDGRRGGWRRRGEEGEE